jgi:hypothetical protein
MAAAHQPQDPLPGEPVDYPAEPDESHNPDDAGDAKVSEGCDDRPPPTLRLRVVPWDAICTIALLTLLIVLATATTWPTRLFGFLANVCTGETCGPVPYGVDYYIYPVVWGGIGAAIAAAGIGPFVSLLKGWYMSFWPVLALTVLMVSSVAGSVLTTFSERYWL